MESRFPELTRRFDGASVLGYLNFSDGRPDPRFRKAIADVYGYLVETADPEPWRTLPAWLAVRAADLEQSGSAAFRNLDQAKASLAAGFRDVPTAYREHHRDLLAHQPDSQLFAPYFLARCCEAALMARSAGKSVAHAADMLDDYVGYRPIAVLETRPQTDFYSHEKVAAIPLYFRGVGTAPGPYAELVRPALELLEKTDSLQLEEACFDPQKLDELSLDPRAVDHFHPVNKRPSVLFGEWDPHRIDGQGYYRRFILRQATLDALKKWVGNGPDRSEKLFEAAAAVCGTILMGAGVSGVGPNHYDSTVTLSTLVQRIARYRDEFYKQLLAAIPGPHGERLREEAARLKQPFASVRQYLNQSIAGERAYHLQERRLSLLFAAMGYPNAARERSANIPAPATRFGTEIRLRQTEAGFATKSGRLADAAELLGEVEDLLRRGIECGALIDPWNILGYQGLYPIFPGRDDTVRDPRAEELILTLGRQFDLYAQGLAAASAGRDRGVAERFQTNMRNLANWWDQFATSTITDLPRVQGSDRTESAEQVAAALALWKTGGATDPAFWRKHREGFRTPAAFAQVIDALLTHGDLRAALALLVTWLSEADVVPLQDPSASFFRLAFRWLRTATTGQIPDADRGPLVRRFFELLEVNADDRWTVPELGVGSRPQEDDEDSEDGEDDEEVEDHDEDDDDPYASAYEGMTFKDSADDGEEGSVAEGGGGVAPGEFALDGETDRAEDRLRFLAAIARLWRTAARPDLWPKSDAASATALGEWLRTARTNLAALRALAERLYSVEVPEPIGGVESVMEFDRRRAVKGQLLELTVQTAVETTAAARALAALLSRPQEITGGPSPADGPTSGLANWEAVAVRLERAVASGDSSAARRLLPAFVSLFRHEPLLVCPPADGGNPVQAVRAQAALQMLESLLARLPRIGLLREAYQLTKLARGMERNDPPEGRRVSSFDQLFRTGAISVVDALLSAAADWGEDAAEDGPLASAIRKVADSFQTLWVDHSVGLRLSALEAVLDRDDWELTRGFIRTYGGDLFTVRFLTLANVRGILGQGAIAWLDREALQGDTDNRPKLVEDWAEETVPDRARTARQFEIVLQSLVEHYDEYRDYNTTTTQSDYGENLYILLDFLRLKVTYDRYAWRLRPMFLTHEVLCRKGFDRLAAKWREFLAARTEKLARELLADLNARETEPAMKVRTVRDRLEERFILPLRIDQAAARVARAAAAARDGQPEDNPSFTGLLAAIRPLADHPSGVGLDVPAWLRRLEEELRKVRTTDIDGDGDVNELYPFPETRGIDLGNFKKQLQDWEKPIGE